MQNKNIVMPILLIDQEHNILNINQTEHMKHMKHMIHSCLVRIRVKKHSNLNQFSNNILNYLKTIVYINVYNY